ncbi:hypothetical protein TM49_15950 [Martelella endophytica]|uniref:Thymidylate synthase n=2 Tax=Martelella endophytica TaxID=1486262 RepID=A0A0D5LSR5_MAREN|nr:hypothetical protein TM49_15950 [Martelella endophytica]
MLKSPATHEREIRKSRFAAIAAPIADEEAARAFIVAESFADASHNCWAWRIGTQYRFSDDGEPGGTAGKPILQAIEGQEVDRCAVLVSRWFGGIKLGTGGLVRAYGGTAAECLRLAEKAPVIAMARITATIGFSDLALVESRLEGAAALTIAARDFTQAGAIFTLSLPESEAEATAALLGDLTHGRAELTVDDTVGDAA